MNSNQENRGLWLVAFVVLAGVLYPQVRESRSGSPSGQGAKSAGEEQSSPSGKGTTKKAESDTCKSEAEHLLRDFFGTPHHASPGKFIPPSYCLQTLIATVPDPLDSRVGWMFDLYVDAIQRAIAEDHYLLDRFLLPWKAAEVQRSGAESTTGSDGPSEGEESRAFGRTYLTHQRRPGVILFRRISDTRELLLLQLVGETPTSGIQKQAFEFAVQTAQDVHALQEEREEKGEKKKKEDIRIIGPSFSGSAASLGIAIEAWLNRGELQFQVITGSATAPQVAKLVAGDGKGSRVSFKSTVNTTTDIQNVIFDRYFKEKLGIKADRAALLVEANTVYGGSVKNPEYTDSHWRPKFILPFPFHISQIPEAPARELSPVVNIVQEIQGDNPRTELSLKEKARVRDVIPMHSELAPAYVELVMSNILGTISREGIQYVGLVATDPRDTLFLAQEIHKSCPDVWLFTLTSDLIYVRPDYLPYTRGMIVASSYPLFTRNQAWTSFQDAGHATQFQFPTNGTEGTYNATRWSLSRTPNSLPVDKFLEIRVPFPNLFSAEKSREDKPPVWLTVVGRNGMWPLEVPDARPGPSPDRRFSPPFVHIPQFLASLFIVITLAILVHCWTCFLVGLLKKQDAGQPREGRLVAIFRPRSTFRYEQLVYLAICFVSFWAVYLFLANLCWISPLLCFRSQTQRSLELELLVPPVSLFCLGTLLWTLWRIGRELISVGTDFWQKFLDRGCRHIGVKPRSGFRAVLCAYAVMAIGCVVALAAVIWLVDWRSFLLSENLGGLLYFERASSLGNGVSPVAPALFLGTAYYFWAYCHLKRLWLLENMSIPCPLPLRNGLGSSGVASMFREARRVLTRPFSNAHFIVRLAVCAVLVLTSGFLISKLMPTYENWGVRVFFWAAWFLLYFAVLLALLKAVYLWYRFDRLLRRLTSHPLLNAYDRLPPDLSKAIGTQIAARIPTIMEMELPVRNLSKLAYGYKKLSRELNSKIKPPAEVLGRLQQAMDDATQTQEKFGEELKVMEGSGKPLYLAGTQTQKQVWRVSRVLTLLLDAYWKGRPGLSEPLREWFQLAEDFVVVLLVTFINQFFAHLRNLFAFITVATVLMVLAIASYPFQPQRWLLIFLGNLILYAVIAAVVIFVQVARNHLLSRIAKTMPDRLTWDRMFLRGVMLYVVVPLVGFLAALFPDLGRYLSSGVEGILRVFK